MEEWGGIPNPGEMPLTPVRRVWTKWVEGCPLRRAEAGSRARPGRHPRENLTVRVWASEAGNSAILKVKFQIPCQIIYP